MVDPTLLARYTDTLTDQNLVPLNGAQITVSNSDGTAATLYDALGNPLPNANPFFTGPFGTIDFYAMPAVYGLRYTYGGRVVRDDEQIVGSPPAFKGDTGSTGPANSTYTSLAALKAAPITNASYIFAPPSGSDGGAVAGTFLYQTAGAPYTADGVNIIALNAVPLTTGALVRQAAAGVNFDGRSVNDKLFETVSITDTRFAGGAKLTNADNSAAIQAAVDYIAAAGGGTVEVPLGKFNYTTVTQKAGVRIVGKGYGSQLNSTNTTRTNGINASGPNSATRISGMSIENIRLTSNFVRGGSATSGNAIRWLWVKDCSISNVWTESWSDSGVSITDSDRVAMSNINIKTCSQGLDVFNDSHDCTVTGLICNDISPYVFLNVEGLAAGSTYRPTGFVGTGIRGTNFGTHGINLVNADRPVVSGWSASGGTGNAEGPGNGLEVYGCTYPVIGDGVAFNNAGYGVKIGPSQDNALICGVTTIGNTGGSLLVTDAGGATSLRVTVSGCKFMEGQPTLVGNASIENVVQAFTLQAATPMARLATTSTVNRNVQIVFASGIDTDQGRIGWDLTTNNGTKIFQVYLDSFAAQILGVTTTALTGAGDNVQSLGAPGQRFTTVYAGTGTINTSDERTKQQIGAIPDAWLDAWGDVEWCRFKFNDAVEAKGDAARWHIGVIAQRVRDVFASHGLDATDIGLLCHDEWAATPAIEEQQNADGDVVVPATPAKPAGDLWSVRMAECQALEAAWMRRELQRLRDAQSGATPAQGA